MILMILVILVILMTLVILVLRMLLVRFLLIYQESFVAIGRITAFTIRLVVVRRVASDYVL